MPLTADNPEVLLNTSEQSGPVHTCRICMLEGTKENPLFHPCKCKGSIKFIHESCMIEWLQSKNVDISKPGADLKCSICNHPIQFRTVYDESMPDKIPLVLLFSKGVRTIMHSFNTYIKTALLYSLLILALPLSWNIWGKLYTAALDDFRFPRENPWYINLIYGFSRTIPTDPSSSDLFVEIMFNYEFSLLQIFLILVLHLALYFQYDMVVKEPVFNKMILHKIGSKYTKKELTLKTFRERFPAMDPREMDILLNIVARNMDNEEGSNNDNESDEELENPIVEER